MDIDPQVGDNLGTMPAGCKSLCSVPNVLSAQTYSVDLRDQCVCNDPLICQCPSTSASMLSDVPMLSDVSMLFALPMTSMNIIRDIFLSSCCTFSYICLMQCHCVLVHHIATGVCAGPRPWGWRTSIPLVPTLGLSANLHRVLTPS
jgi:hypothetical protein